MLLADRSNSAVELVAPHFHRLDAPAGRVGQQALGNGVGHQFHCRTRQRRLDAADIGVRLGKNLAGKPVAGLTQDATAASSDIHAEWKVEGMQPLSR